MDWGDSYHMFKPLRVLMNGLVLAALDVTHAYTLDFPNKTYEQFWS